MLHAGKVVDVIYTAEENSSVSVWTLADLFQCGKAQTACVHKNKGSILSLYDVNASLSSCHARWKVIALCL